MRHLKSLKSGRGSSDSTLPRFFFYTITFRRCSSLVSPFASSQSFFSPWLITGITSAPPHSAVSSFSDMLSELNDRSLSSLVLVVMPSEHILVYSRVVAILGLQFCFSRRDFPEISEVFLMTRRASLWKLREFSLSKRVPDPMFSLFSLSGRAHLGRCRFPPPRYNIMVFSDRFERLSYFLFETSFMYP